MSDCISKKNIAKAVKIECSVCVNEVNERKIVSCSYCKYEACSNCVQKFLMDIDDDNPRCMNCKKVWTLDFLSENFMPSFHNKLYRDRRIDLLLQKEKSLLPATQYLVSEVIARNKKEEEINEIVNENKMLTALLNSNKIKIQNLRYNNMIVKPSDSEKKIFVRACPRNECRGFLSTQLKCELCEKYSCKNCHAPVDEDHECNQDVVATIKLLSKDTKNCPNCSTPIYKIHGCDQMYCTRCHTAFSWNKGTIERGVVHNPHYYEFQRLQNNGVAPRVVGDNRCGEYVSLETLNRAIIDDTNRVSLHLKHRLMNHIRYNELPKYTLNNNIQEYNQQLRVDYLIKNIDEKTWVKKLKENIKKKEKSNSINMVLTMLCTTMSHIFGNMIEDKKNIKMYIESLEQLRIYTNLALVKIGYRFGTTVPCIDDSWGYKLNSKHT